MGEAVLEPPEVLPEFVTWLRLQQRKAALRHRASAHHRVSCAPLAQIHCFYHMLYLCLWEALPVHSHSTCMRKSVLKHKTGCPAASKAF